MYYLVNIGAIVYYHGDSREPDMYADARLVYAKDEDLSDEEQGIDATEATIRARPGRDWHGGQAGAAATMEDGPVLGLLDQRLLYWPFGQRQDADKVAYDWCNEMTRIHAGGALLAGYIDRPGKRSVVSLLQGLEGPALEAIKRLDRPRQGGDLTDIHLFSNLLGPGERSRVFAEMSPVNTRFALQDIDNEVCFFYYNPSRLHPDESSELWPGVGPRRYSAVGGAQPVGRGSGPRADREPVSRVGRLPVCAGPG